MRPNEDLPKWHKDLKLVLSILVLTLTIILVYAYKSYNSIEKRVEQLETNQKK